MKRVTFTMMLCLLAAGAVWAQGSIRGTATLKSLNQSGEEVLEPLVLGIVFVTYGGERMYTRTNQHGDYLLRPLEPGTYVVVITAPDIDTTIIPDVRVVGTTVTFIEEVVIAKGVTLPRVTIVDREPPLAAENPGKMQIRGSELAFLPDQRNINQIIGLFGGAYVSDDGRQISFRGARIGDALYIIDGVRQRSTDISLPGRSIAAITSWNGGIPAQYGDFLGGVVVIETMSYFDWENQQEVKRLIAKREADQEKFRQQIEERRLQREQSPEADPSAEEE
jgi:hypothetical protein